MKKSFLLIAALVLASCVPNKDALLDQYPKTDTPAATVSLLTDDPAMKTYLKTNGPVKTMEEMTRLSHEAGQDCHNRAHQLGRMSYEEFGSDVFKLVLPECHSGFYHGAIEAFFHKNGTDRLQENLSLICIDGLNGFFTHQCLHGIGHGLMAWSDYDLPAALEYCNLLPNGTGQSSCRTGAFMENIVGSLDTSPEAKLRGHVSKFVSDDPHYPCNIVKEEYKNDCYFLQTDRMVTLSNGNFETVARDCEKAPERYHTSCFGSMGRTIGGRFRGNPTEAIRNCEYAKDNQNRIHCILGAGQDTFWDKHGETLAVAYCAVVPENEGKRQCYDTIINRSLEVLKPDDQRAFCELLPEEYKSGCLSTSV
ncbi:MAG TPA: hypothetical protein VI873_01015 [Candidatus Peribacteraceae bacterium]|nr:hypothetical protein [Candidatus Peribacteraceae bacterium]